jgi:integrating conjugative element membrane protein (TIGR03747 family)
MFLWWPEEGVHHSERMLAQELPYLNEDFRESFANWRPAELAGRAAALVQQALEAVGIRRFVDGLEGPSEPLANRRSTTAGHHISSFRVYAEAMGNVMQTFAVRVMVLVLATPVFALFGAVGLAEGLMIRDLRRWGGGRESSFLYHHSKKLLGPSILSAWMLYLAVPFTVHPNLVLLPFATLFAAGVVVTTATFKKYL